MRSTFFVTILLWRTDTDKSDKDKSESRVDFKFSSTSRRQNRLKQEMLSAQGVLFFFSRTYRQKIPVLTDSRRAGTQWPKAGQIGLVMFNSSGKLWIQQRKTQSQHLESNWFERNSKYGKCSFFCCCSIPKVPPFYLLPKPLKIRIQRNQ
jgi:hypothetical protein